MHALMHLCVCMSCTGSVSARRRLWRGDRQPPVERRNPGRVVAIGVTAGCFTHFATAAVTLVRASAAVALIPSCTSPREPFPKARSPRGTRSAALCWSAHIEGGVLRAASPPRGTSRRLWWSARIHAQFDTLERHRMSVALVCVACTAYRPSDLLRPPRMPLSP